MSEISKGPSVELFLEKCKVILEVSRVYQASSQSLLPSADEAGVPSPRVPTFHEQWYAESELTMLEAAVRFIRPLPGAIVEIGCLEGRSTAVIANACYPESVVAVDTWRGSSSEDPGHVTVRIARERDVFATFRDNMRVLTRGNVVPECTDSTDFLQRMEGPIKFCHIDAAHDYATVWETIGRVLPRLVACGVLFGHDYEAAHAGREDLQGGVQRAVCELLPDHVARGNTWWYVHMKRP